MAERDEPEGVEEGTESFHDDEAAEDESVGSHGREEERGNVHADGEGEPERKHDKEERDSRRSLHIERSFDSHAITTTSLAPLQMRGEGRNVPPEHLGELSVRERQGPETQVRSRVGDATEAELDRVCAKPSDQRSSAPKKRLKGRTDDLVNDVLAHIELLYHDHRQYPRTRHTKANAKRTCSSSISSATTAAPSSSSSELESLPPFPAATPWYP